MPGGPVKVFDLCTNLKSMGHDVVLFAPDNGCPETQTTAKVVKIPAFGIPIFGIIWHELLSLAASLLELRHGACSAVFVRITTSFVPLFMKSVTGAVLLTDVNDDPFYRYRETRGGMRLKLPLVRFCDRLNLKLSDAVFTINSKVKKALVGGFGLDEDKVSILPSGANTDIFRPLDRAKACAELSLAPELRYVCFAGSLNKWNDYPLIISAAKEILGAFPDVRLLLLGDLDDACRELIAGTGLGGRFILTGRVAQQKAAAYIACSEVGLSALTGAGEAVTPVKIFDYLACGKPVVAAMPRGTNDFFQDCEAVAVTDAGDAPTFLAAISRFLEDPERASRLGGQGRALILERFDRAAVARRVAEAAETSFRGSPPLGGK